MTKVCVCVCVKFSNMTESAEDDEMLCLSHNLLSGRYHVPGVGV